MTRYAPRAELPKNTQDACVILWWIIRSPRLESRWRLARLYQCCWRGGGIDSQIVHERRAIAAEKNYANTLACIKLRTQGDLVG
jgi:hypothetical protein